MKKTIWLVRHGESAANAGLATTSPESIPLTEQGHRQAEVVAASFSVAPSLIITSPFVRAIETSVPTQVRFPSSNVEQWPVHEFTYLCLGDPGETTAEDRRPFVEEYWNRGDAEHCDGPGAESFRSFMDRASSTLQELLVSEHQFIAMFSHGQFIRALMWLSLTRRDIFDSAAMREFAHFLQSVPYPNAGILEMILADGEPLLGSVQSIVR